MKITPNFAQRPMAAKSHQNTKNQPAFTHIYSEAVDAFRSTSENYGFRYVYDAYDDYKDSPMMVEYYRIEKNSKGTRLNEDQISRLEDLVQRAAKLKKTVIATYRGDKTILSIADSSSKYIEDSKSGHKIMAKMKKEDPEYNLQQFENIVNTAEELENTDLEEMDKPKQFGKEKFASIDKDRVQERFSNIYNNTFYL